jgi:hypothetical protein
MPASLRRASGDSATTNKSAPTRRFERARSRLLGCPGTSAPSLTSRGGHRLERARHRPASNTFGACPQAPPRQLHVNLPDPTCHPVGRVSPGEKTLADPDLVFLQRGPCIFCYSNPRSSATPADPAQSAPRQHLPGPPVSLCGWISPG